MGKVDRAPEPTLEDILSTIRQFSADIAQAGRGMDATDTVTPPSNAAVIDDVLLPTSQPNQDSPTAPTSQTTPERSPNSDNVLLPTSQPNQDSPTAPTTQTTPERSPNGSVGVSPADKVAASLSGELARGQPETKKSRPRLRSRPLRKFQTASSDSSAASASDIRLKDAVDAARPLLRRWLNENMAKVFANVLLDEFTQTGMPLWKARRQRNRWRRWFRHSHG